MTVHVVTAAQSAARDRAAIDGGVPSRALMQRAGAAAASEIVRHLGEHLARGVAVFAGVGNNGGDAWVVASALAAVGIRVRVEEVGEPKTADARAERETARASYTFDRPTGAEAVVVDGVLGTGSSGAPRGTAADAVQRICALRENGAHVVALDIPSGVDASTGDAELAVAADLTLTFGAVKRGLLVRRELCGHIVVIDIGLGHHATRDDGAGTLIDDAWVRERVPDIAANAHKGIRRRVAIVGGAPGMAGASTLAAAAALRSGVGMARVIVNPASVSAVQTSVPAALTRTWPESDAEVQDSICDWAHAVVIGPGLGRAEGTRARIERLLRVWSGPVVLDADALTAFEGDARSLATLLNSRHALITPHVVEFSRLSGLEPDHVIRSAFDVGHDLARQLRCVVLLKGVPTVLTDPRGRVLVSAAGSPVLASGGSGDALAGVAATLVAQMDDVLDAAACAAWIHGRAGELAGSSGTRGATITDVVDALPEAWNEPVSRPRPPVIAELTAVRTPRSGVRT